MATRVTQDMVLLYVTGHLSPDDRREVEAEFPRNIHVQTWFVRLGALPDTVAHTSDVPEPEIEAVPIPEPAVIRRTIKEFADQLLGSVDGRKLDFGIPVSVESVARFLRGWTIRVAFAGGFDDGNRPPFPELSVPYIEFFENKIYIEQPKGAVPYGVVRIIASADGTPLASIARVMDFNEQQQTWGLTVAVTELFGLDVPKRDLDFYVQPARRDLISWFPGQEIEKLVANIRDSGRNVPPQVERLLREHEEYENGI